MKRAMLSGALLCAALGGAVASLGWEDSLGALALTPPAGESLQAALLRSATVLLGRFALVLLAPILALTASAWAAVEFLAARRRAPPATSLLKRKFSLARSSVRPGPR